MGVSNRRHRCHPVDALIPLLLALLGCDPDTTTVTGDGVRVVLGDVEELVLAKRIEVALDEAAAPRLDCEATDEPDERHVREAASGELHTLDLYGLLADTTYACEVSAGSASASFELTTDPLPAWAPTWTVSGETDGYTLFNHVLNGLEANEQKLVIVDPLGQVRWYRVLPEEVAGDVDARYLGDDTVLYGGGYGGRPRRIDLAGETVWRLGQPHIGRSHHHHTERLDDGSVLSLVTTTNRVEEAKEDWTGWGVEVVDPARDELLWVWDSQQAVDAGQLPIPSKAGDPYHANSAWWTTDAEGDGIWLSLRNLDQLVRLDRDSGVFSWALGVDGDFELLGPDGEPADDADWFHSQHAPELTGDTLLVYDNGIGRPGGSYSRAAMYRLDIPGRVAQLTWSWTEDHWKEGVWGDADLLESGRVLIAKGHCWDCSSSDPDGRSALVEVDPETDQVPWRLDFTGEHDGLYRAQRIAGCELFASERWCPDLSR